MSTTTHDLQCDRGQQCLMCQETTPCCPDCDLDDREQGVMVPTFADDWQQAPRTVRRLVAESDAEYWWLLGQRAGRISEQVETWGWLQMVMEGYKEQTQ